LFYVFNEQVHRFSRIDILYISRPVAADIWEKTNPIYSFCTNGIRFRVC
jgi:hypothetical protein